MYMAGYTAYIQKQCQYSTSLLFPPYSFTSPPPTPSFFRETDKTERQNIEETAKTTKTREFLPRKPLRQSTLIILTKYLTTSIALGSCYSQCVPIKKSKRIRMLEDEGIGILVSTPPRGIRQPAQLRLNVIKTTERVLQTTVRRVYLA